MTRVYTKGYAKKYGERRYYYPDAYRRYQAKHGHRRKKQESTRAWIAELKASPCLDCGNRFPPECMDYDHCRGVKKFGIGTSHLRSREVILAEIAKCDLVCANCHRIRTLARKKAQSKSVPVYVQDQPTLALEMT